MKQTMISVFFALALFISSAGNAQDKDSVVTLPTVTVTALSKVNERVSRAFKSSFPKATNSRCYKMNKDYLVKFIKNDMKHHTLFHKNGIIKYDISYGMAHNLPAAIGEQVISVYKGYAITQVAKVERYKEDFWIIYMEGLSDVVVLRIEDGDIEEVGHYEKWDSQ